MGFSGSLGFLARSRTIQSNKTMDILFDVVADGSKKPEKPEKPREC
jgi:hypothetical protein